MMQWVHSTYTMMRNMTCQAGGHQGAQMLPQQPLEEQQQQGWQAEVHEAAAAGMGMVGKAQVMGMAGKAVAARSDTLAGSHQAGPVGTSHRRSGVQCHSSSCSSSTRTNTSSSRISSNSSRPQQSNPGKALHTLQWL